MNSFEKFEHCPKCFGRGYIPEYRRGKVGFYARTCRRCGGSGYFSNITDIVGYEKAVNANKRKDVIA